MKIMDEKQLISFIKRGERIIFLKGARLTPSAQDLVRRHGLKIVEESAGYIPAVAAVHRVAIGSDHGGFHLKEYLIKHLESAGYFVQDVGTTSTEAVDYPDFAFEVARQVAEGKADRGVIIDSLGNASAICANRIRGVRAAVCWTVEVAKSARSHNDANVITLGGKIMNHDQAGDILDAFLKEPFSGGRHETRVRKIEAL